jgi:hypothetical protein
MSVNFNSFGTGLHHGHVKAAHSASRKAAASAASRPQNARFLLANWAKQVADYSGSPLNQSLDW